MRSEQMRLGQIFNSLENSRFSRLFGRLFGRLVASGAAIAGACWLLPVGQASPIVLGVVRSPDNQAVWQGISTRLQTASVPYRIVDWQQVDGIEDLQGLTVLFLPNVKTLTPQQIIVVETWMSQGGRVIVSGEIGQQSPSGVQQALRSLLGAYWDSPVRQPSQLQLVANDPQPWVNPSPSATALTGGILIPTSTDSRTIAVWQGLPQPTPTPSFPTPSALPTPTSSVASSNPAAVVATDRTIFLGWQWGADAGKPAEVDHAWLKASLSRYGVSPTAVTRLPSSNVPIAVPTAQPPTPVDSNPLLMVSSSPAVSETPAQVSSPTPSPTTAQPPAASSPVASPVSPRPPAVDVDPDDPTHQSLFPPTRVVVNNSPISYAEAARMVRELEHLAGRVESALISVYATDTPVSLRFRSQAPETKTTIVAPGDAGEGLSSSSSGTLVPSVWDSAAMGSVLQARNFLKTFPRLVARRDYLNARRQWMQHQQQLLRNYPVNQPVIHPEIRAIWLDRGTIVRAGSEAGLTVIFDRFAAAGINTVFLETVNAGYPIFPSQVAPPQNPQLQGWDALESAVKLAHQRKMQLHAWVWVFAVGNERHNQLLGLPANYPGPLLAANPSWANYDNRGSLTPIGQPKPFLDPANPEARQYLLSLFQEIVTRYPVDGLQLDYIRYPFQEPATNRTYGYGQASRKAFQELTGVDPRSLSPTDPDHRTPAASADGALRAEFKTLTGIDPLNINPNGTNPVVVTTENAQTKNVLITLPERELWQQWTAFRIRRNRELWKQWTDFRVEQVSSFVAEVSETLRRSRPNLVLSAAVFPMPERVRLLKIQQHWEVWVKRGDLDLLVPMTYATDTNRFQQLTEPLRELGSPRATFVLPGIRLLNLPAAIAVDQIQTLRDSSFEGYSLFAAQDFNDAYHTLFARTQGVLAQCNLQQLDCSELSASPLPPTLKPEPIPYRQPFQTAHTRYLTLKREWSFLLAEGKLMIADDSLQVMRLQAEVLERSLSRLAISPSRQTINQATQELQAFRKAFATWMQPHAQNHPYQVQVWENRLATIETLLRYGDRTLTRLSGR